MMEMNKMTKILFIDLECYNLYNLYNLFISLLVIGLIFPKRGEEVIDVMGFIFKSYNLEQNSHHFYVKNETHSLTIQ